MPVVEDQRSKPQVPSGSTESNKKLNETESKLPVDLQNVLAEVYDIANRCGVALEVGRLGLGDGGRKNGLLEAFTRERMSSANGVM